MPLNNYGVLKGHVTDMFKDEDDRPHLHILVHADAWHDISINVRSVVNAAVEPIEGVPGNQLLFQIVEDFQHPSLEALEGLALGFHSLDSEPGGMAVDYIRGNYFQKDQMKPLPADKAGPDNDLFERIGDYIQRAMVLPNTLVYAFGEPWFNPNQPNSRFGFRPDRGIHDIHMNQGSEQQYGHSNGVWQDGALFFHFVDTDRWVGLFLAFQSQCWHSDDQTGHAIPNRCTQADTVEALVRVVAATVNPSGGDSGAETVFLLNTANNDIDLSGWSLADKMKRKEPLSGVIKGNDMRKIVLSGDHALLGNSGGLITVLDDEGLKVHGVSYTGKDVRSGETLVF